MNNLQRYLNESLFSGGGEDVFVNSANDQLRLEEFQKYVDCGQKWAPVQVSCKDGEIKIIGLYHPAHPSLTRSIRIHDLDHTPDFNISSIEQCSAIQISDSKIKDLKGIFASNCIIQNPGPGDQIEILITRCNNLTSIKGLENLKYKNPGNTMNAMYFINDCNKLSELGQLPSVLNHLSIVGCPSIGKNNFDISQFPKTLSGFQGFYWKDNGISFIDFCKKMGCGPKTVIYLEDLQQRHSRSPYEINANGEFKIYSHEWRQLIKNFKK